MRPHLLHKPRAQAFHYTRRKSTTLLQRRQPSLGLILFPQQRHAAPLHDSSRFTLCPGEKKDGERETHVCVREKGASEPPPPWKVKFVDPSSHPKINGAVAARVLVLEKSPKEAENTKDTAASRALTYSIRKGKVPQAPSSVLLSLTPPQPVAC